MLNKQALYPAIKLMAIYAFKPNSLAGLHEPANRFQTQIFCFVHADFQSPACLILQAHLVLEKSKFCVFPDWAGIISLCKF